MDRRAFLKFSAAAVGLAAAPTSLISAASPTLPEKVLVTIPWIPEWMEMFRAMTQKYVRDYQITNATTDYDRGQTYVVLRRRDLIPSEKLASVWGFWANNQGVVRGTPDAIINWQ